MSEELKPASVMVTVRMWRLCSAIYRGLVAAQTIALAAIALRKIMNGQPRASAPGLIGMVLSIVALLGLAGGLLAYYRRGRRPGERGAIIATWALIQIAGLSALAGYALTGGAVCFAAMVMVLAAMHVFSPNRFAPERTR